MIAEELSKALFTTDGKTINRFCRIVFGIEKDTPISFKHVIAISIYDWFNHLHIFSDSQISEVMGFLKPRIDSLEDAPNLSEAVNDVQVILSMYRYVSVTKFPEFFDAVEGVKVPSMPAPAITHTVCDVAALYRTIDNRLARIHKGLLDACITKPSNGENSGG